MKKQNQFASDPTHSFNQFQQPLSNSYYQQSQQYQNNDFQAQMFNNMIKFMSQIILTSNPLFMSMMMQNNYPTNPIPVPYNNPYFNMNAQNHPIPFPNVYNSMYHYNEDMNLKRQSNLESSDIKSQNRPPFYQHMKQSRQKRLKEQQDLKKSSIQDYQDMQLQIQNKTQYHQNKKKQNRVNLHQNMKKQSRSYYQQNMKQSLQSMSAAKQEINSQQIQTGQKNCDLISENEFMDERQSRRRRQFVNQSEQNFILKNNKLFNKNNYLQQGEQKIQKNEFKKYKKFDILQTNPIVQRQNPSNNSTFNPSNNNALLLNRNIYVRQEEAASQKFITYQQIKVNEEQKHLYNSNELKQIKAVNRIQKTNYNEEMRMKNNQNLNLNERPIKVNRQQEIKIGKGTAFFVQFNNNNNKNKMNNKKSSKKIINSKFTNQLFDQIPVKGEDRNFQELLQQKLREHNKMGEEKIYQEEVPKKQFLKRGSRQYLSSAKVNFFKQDKKLKKFQKNNQIHYQVEQAKKEYKKKQIFKQEEQKKKLTSDIEKQKKPFLQKRKGKGGGLGQQKKQKKNNKGINETIESSQKKKKINLFNDSDIIESDIEQQEYDDNQIVEYIPGVQLKWKVFKDIGQKYIKDKKEKNQLKVENQQKTKNIQIKYEKHFKMLQKKEIELQKEKQQFQLFKEEQLKKIKQMQRVQQRQVKANLSTNHKKQLQEFQNLKNQFTTFKQQTKKRQNRDKIIIQKLKKQIQQLKIINNNVNQQKKLQSKGSITKNLLIEQQKKSNKKINKWKENDLVYKQKQGKKQKKEDIPSYKNIRKTDFNNKEVQFIQQIQNLNSDQQNLNSSEQNEQNEKQQFPYILQTLNAIDNLDIQMIGKKISVNQFLYNNNSYYKQYLKSLPNCKIVSQNVSSDGKVHRKYSDGKKQIVYYNGVRKQIIDNYSIVHFKNNDIKQTLPDGTIIYYFCEADTCQITLINNTNVFLFQKIYRFTTGQIQFHFQNNLKQIRFPNGIFKSITQ